MTFNIKKLGDDLKTIREARKINLRDAWKEIGVTTAALSRIERGIHPGIHTTTLVKLCMWMGKHPNDYFN